MDLTQRLEQHGIRPSAQRLAIGAYVLETDDHPSADEVWQRVSPTLPMVSRATVYNTLNLFVEKGLLRQVVVGPGCVLFDPNLEKHHHLVDEESGRVLDVPWEALDVRNANAVPGYEVSDFEVVLRGKRSAHPKRSKAR